MNDRSTSRDLNWGLDFPPMQLPGPEDLAELRRLGQQAPPAGAPSPLERTRQAIQSGWLKDLAASFSAELARDGKTWSQRRVANLAAVVEAFEAAAAALGYDPSRPPPENQRPQLRMKDSRIDASDLSSANINWPVRLEHCVWTCPAVFIGVGFGGPVSFLGSAFFADATFFAAGFAAQAFFGGVDFHGSADFRGATFGGEVSFFGANFRESLELRFAVLEEESVLNIQELRFRGSTALGGSLHLQLGQLRTGRWPKFRGRVAGENARDVRDLAVACEQYGELEANFAAQGSPDASAARDWCHYRYMDLARRAHVGRRSPMRLWDWLFLKWCFGYGIFTKRILVTGVVVLVLFALLYLTNGLGLPSECWAVESSGPQPANLAEDGPWAVRLGNALYFSGVTFSTIGYGDWHPLHWAKLAGALEGLLGVFIMAVFTVSFSRKILR